MHFINKARTIFSTLSTRYFSYWPVSFLAHAFTNFGAIFYGPTLTIVFWGHWSCNTHTCHNIHNIWRRRPSSLVLDTSLQLVRGHVSKTTGGDVHHIPSLLPLPPGEVRCWALPSFCMKVFHACGVLEKSSAEFIFCYDSKIAVLLWCTCNSLCCCSAKPLCCCVFLHCCSPKLFVFTL